MCKWSNASSFCICSSVKLPLVVMLSPGNCFPLSNNASISLSKCTFIKGSPPEISNLRILSALATILSIIFRYQVLLLLQSCFLVTSLYRSGSSILLVIALYCFSIKLLLLALHIRQAVLH